MHVIETGGITSEPKMIIHLEKYEVEKIQSGQSIQLNMGMGDSIHKTVEVQPEAQDSLNIIEEEIDIIEKRCRQPEPFYDSTYEALGKIIEQIDNANYTIKAGGSVLDSYEGFISHIEVQDAIESYFYYQEELAQYR